MGRPRKRIPKEEMEYPNNVLEWREKRGLSALELADELGYSEAHINRIEQGKQRLNVDHLRALSKVLDVSKRDLVDEGKFITISGCLNKNGEVILYQSEACNRDNVDMVECPDELVAEEALAIEVSDDYTLPIGPGFVAVCGSEHANVPYEYVGKVCLLKLASDSKQDSNNQSESRLMAGVVKAGTKVGHYTIERLGKNEGPLRNQKVESSRLIHSWRQKV